MSPNISLLNDARILFLPGGRWQVPAIEILRHSGAFVICCDSTTNAPGFAAANAFVQCSLQDEERLVGIGHQFSVNCVMTDQTDFAVTIVSRITSKLGLRGLPPAVAHTATNKAAMRSALRQTSVRQPRFRVCRTPKDLIDTVTELGLPLFIKPVDAQSSRGVAKIITADPQILAQQLAHATSQSTVSAAIVEEYISGTECTVEGFVDSNGPQVLAISDKSHYPDLTGVARTLTYPAAFPESTRLEIIDAHTQIVHTLGIELGITHTEFIVDSNNHPWLVETAARGGGSLISSHIVPAVSGFNPILGLAQQLLGRPVEVNRTSQRAAELRFLKLLPGGQIVSFPNIESLRGRDGVLWIHMDAEPGHILRSVVDDRSRHGFVISVGNDRGDAIRIAKLVEQDFQVQYLDETPATPPAPHFASGLTRSRIHES